ncbi:MAG: hypothetical protein J6Z25_01395 [Opitutales bacterium]|nr:hypothetical protein [Opitutales bacterium]
MTTIHTAQETKLNPNDYSHELTQFANTLLKEMEKPLNFIAPTVFVKRFFEHRKDTDLFSSPINDIRSTGSNFKYIDSVGEKVQSKTLNKGLTTRVDSDDLVKDCEERHVFAMVKLLLENEYRRAIQAYIDTIKKAQKNTKKQLTEIGPWEKDKSPDADLRNLLLTAWKDYGFSPNRIVMHQNVSYTRYVSCAQQNNAGANTINLPLGELAKLLSIEDIQLIQPYVRGLEGDEIFVFLAQNGLPKDDASSAITRFVTPFDDGNLFQVYVETHPKFIDITIEYYSDISVTASGYILQGKLKSA